MHSTLVSGWTVTNLGPLTTTYTAPPSCSTDNVYIQIGETFVDSGTNDTRIFPVGMACNEPVPSFGSCLPSGAKLDEAYSSVDTDQVSAGYTVAYYSPGLVCPSGWSTVGVATKTEGGSITSSGPGFVNPSPEPDFTYVNNVGPNVLLAGMDEGDAAVLCCPSSYTADAQGACSSIVSSYSVPNEYCIRVIDDDSSDRANTTLSIFGTTVTGTAFGTGTITTETMTLETPTESYVGVSYVAMLYLVHDATETATGSSSPTSSPSPSSSSSSAASANARVPRLASAALIVSTLFAAFTSGFMLLMA
ncbi:hypothetical protein J7T55_006608 [Diaporthe amygdali]|uniref:uncharacterized protein n=1 Tax=Phomopsis amygdali TaxID=1214568 RepID=UPI0022FE301B|nr:uncharacterized protein J7T55_006608 [Diaporthe amygdali]KAJ0125263.1 hypothetical protein J7T55_006608 [Diaporthe amygdali]